LYYCEGHTWKPKNRSKKYRDLYDQGHKEKGKMVYHAEPCTSRFATGTFTIAPEGISPGGNGLATSYCLYSCVAGSNWTYVTSGTDYDKLYSMGTGTPLDATEFCPGSHERENYFTIAPNGTPPAGISAAEYNKCQGVYGGPCGCAN
jgi:hypothetical protein